MDTLGRLITDAKKNHLYLMLEDIKAEYRAKIILIKDYGYIVSQIRNIPKDQQPYTVMRRIKRILKKKKLNEYTYYYLAY
jgi:hypothetical protein